MPLLEHLRELRSRVVKSALAIILGSGIGWFYYNTIITQLAKPVCDLKAAQQSGASSCGSLYINGVLGPLNLQIKVAVLSGIIITAPIWLYQLWAFIAPALHRKEKRNSILFFMAATPFFAVGAYLGYTVLPVAVRVLFGFTPSALTNLVKFDDYLDFVLRVILLFWNSVRASSLSCDFQRDWILIRQDDPSPLANLDIRNLSLYRGVYAECRSTFHVCTCCASDSSLSHGWQHCSS